MELTNLSVIRELMSRHGFSPSKGFGQNFIINPAVCPRMAEEAVQLDGVGVLEIGPGIGVLTAELAACAEKVVAIEIDKKLLPVLKETLAGMDNVKVINADVMELDLAALIAEEFPGMEVVVCANLPYYITTPIIMKLLEDRLPVTAITVMVQKEAAQRLCSPPGTRECGAISAGVWYYSTPEKLFDVSRGSFFPSPDVDSSVIRLTVNTEPPVKLNDSRQFFRVVKAAFAQRRKTLANTLSSSLPMDKAKVTAALENVGIAPGARAETLTLEQLALAAEALAKAEAV